MAEAKLGSPDPLAAGDGDRLCNDLSDVVVGMPAPFVCTRARGHVDRRVAEHVASAPYESRLPIAVGAWVTGGAPRIYEVPR